MIRLRPEEESGGEEQERPTPQHATPRTPEPEHVMMMGSQQKLFEDMHEKLVYDTAEEKLLN